MLYLYVNGIGARPAWGGRSVERRRRGRVVHPAEPAGGALRRALALTGTGPRRLPMRAVPDRPCCRALAPVVGPRFAPELLPGSGEPRSAAGRERDGGGDRHRGRRGRSHPGEGVREGLGEGARPARDRLDRGGSDRLADEGGRRGDARKRLVGPAGRPAEERGGGRFGGGGRRPGPPPPPRGGLGDEPGPG